MKIFIFLIGNILLNSLEIENLTAKLSTVLAFYGRSFKLFDKPAKFDIVVPYSFGELNALLNKVDTTAQKYGFMDPTFRISMILVGDEALNIQNFASREIKKFKLGTSFKIRAPLGKY